MCEFCHGEFITSAAQHTKVTYVYIHCTVCSFSHFSFLFTYPPSPSPIPPPIQVSSLESYTLLAVTVPAGGGVVLMATVSHVATVGSADYAVDVIHASGLLHGPLPAQSWSCTMFPFVLVVLTTQLHLGHLLRDSSGSRSPQEIMTPSPQQLGQSSEIVPRPARRAQTSTFIRLPISQTGTEKCTH